MLRRQLRCHRALRAAQDEGPDAVASWRRRDRVAILLDRRAEAAGEVLRGPSRPGIRKANWDHSSPRLFSIGVPDRHSRCRVSSRQTACVALAVGS